MEYIPIDTDQFTASYPSIQCQSSSGSVGTSVSGSNSGWISEFFSLPTNSVITPIIILY